MQKSGHDPIIGDYITLKELAKYLLLHPATLNRWDRTGHLKADKIGKNKVYNVGEIQEKLDSGKI